MIIRRAVAADWPRIWPVWHEIVAAGDTYTYRPDTTSDQARAGWLGDSADEAWLAETVSTADGPDPAAPGAGAAAAGAAAAGAAAAGAENADADATGRSAFLGTYHLSANQAGPGAHVANASYMVATEHRGHGVGRELVAHSIERAGVLGYRGIQFNAVAATNTGAIALYRRLGFVTIGVVPGGFRHPAQGFVDLHVMYRPL